MERKTTTISNSYHTTKHPWAMKDPIVGMRQISSEATQLHALEPPTQQRERSNNCIFQYSYFDNEEEQGFIISFTYLGSTRTSSNIIPSR